MFAPMKFPKPNDNENIYSRMSYILCPKVFNCRTQSYYYFKVSKLAAHLLFQYTIGRNNLARAMYFLVLNSFGFENLKQKEIPFSSEATHSGQQRVARFVQWRRSQSFDVLGLSFCLFVSIRPVN
jgi:hypothetical protein